MKRLVVINLVVFIAISAISQIKGVVYEQVKGSKKGLAGVNIFWTGTNEGTVSDNLGYFQISRSLISDTLVFSFVGYKTEKIKVNSNENYIEIVLSESVLLDEVVVGERREGTFYSKMEVGNVQNITGAELCKAACCNLSESFETNASVDANYNDAVTGAKQIKLLGLAGKYVQFLTENIPNLYGVSQPFALTYIPGPWMESIQVSKGTATVINGYDAIIGQINVEYKKPKNQDKLFVNQFISSAGMSETNIDRGININSNLRTSIFAHYGTDLLKLDHNKDGFVDLPMINQLNLFNRWDYFSRNITIRAGIKYIDEQRKGGQTSYNFDINPENTNLYGILIKTKRLELFTKGGYVFPEKKYKSLAMIFNFVNHLQNSFYGKRFYDANQYSGYFNLLWQSNFAGNEKQKYNAGFSLKYEDLKQIVSDSIQNINITEKEIVPGIYFQYTGNLTNKISVIAGLREDYHNKYGFLFTPRLNIKYNVTEKFIWKASAGKGFRNANVYAENNFLLASARKINVIGELKLEEAWNYGTSITIYLPFGRKDMTLQTEFYRTDFVNQVIVDFETPREIKFYNLIGKSYSNTMQFEIFYYPFEGFDITAAIRLNDVKQTLNGSLLTVPLTSKYKGLINLSYKTPMEKWQFDFTSQFNGKGRIPAMISTDLSGSEFPSYTILNAQITKYFRHWEIYTGCENLTNFVQPQPIVAYESPFSKDFDSSLIWGPVHGRKFYLGIRFDLN